jgi:hypothetical protein
MAKKSGKCCKKYKDGKQCKKCPKREPGVHGAAASTLCAGHGIPLNR